jgi:hypothetical protein
MQTTNAVHQPVTLRFPLSRLDGKPDNSPLSIAAALNERGFEFTSGEVIERDCEGKVERTLTLIGTSPAGSRSAWVPHLLATMRKLSTYCIDIDEQDTVELAAKLDGALLTS